MADANAASTVVVVVDENEGCAPTHAAAASQPLAVLEVDEAALALALASPTVDGDAETDDLDLALDVDGGDDGFEVIEGVPACFSSDDPAAAAAAASATLAAAPAATSTATAGHKGEGPRRASVAGVGLGVAAILSPPSGFQGTDYVALGEHLAIALMLANAAAARIEAQTPEFVLSRNGEKKNLRISLLFFILFLLPFSNYFYFVQAGSRRQ